MDIDGDGVDMPVAYPVVPSLGLRHGSKEDASRRKVDKRIQYVTTVTTLPDRVTGPGS
jgi:hypothetical protein